MKTVKTTTMVIFVLTFTFAIPIMISLKGMWWLFPVFFVLLRLDREQMKRHKEMREAKKNLDEYERLEQLYYQMPD